MSGPLAEDEPDADLPDATVRYADHEHGVIDLHLPPGAARGVLVLVHGGFWKAEYDRRPTRPMAAALATEGWVVASPEYRRVRAGGGWPVTGDDVRRAVERLPELLSGLDLPTGPVSVAGHSAGGHLALWLATCGLELSRVVGLAPVCDLGEAIRLDLGGGATEALLQGRDPAEADPMVLLADRPDVPVRIVHGRDDEDVPVSLSRGLVRRHRWVELVEVDCGHFEVIEPGSVAWPAVLAALSRGPLNPGR